MGETRVLPRSTELMPSGSTLVLGGEAPGAPESVTGGYITIGTALKEKYRITGVVSESTGEGAIFIAQDGQKEVVAKVYHVNKKPKEEIRQAIRQIDSPHVVKVIDEGEAYGRYFEIIPFYRNGDLQSAAPLDEDFIINTVVPQVNEALRAIHDRGIVHRDIKPNNLFFNENRDGVVVGDFGISSVIDSKQSVRLTNASRTLGYSAPETAQGFVSKESDYYSFGVTLLHLATGVDPFFGMTDPQILKVTLTDKLPIPSNLHPRIALLIRGLTVKERKDRWGYEEVASWCKGQTPVVEDTRRKTAGIKPYVFEGREIFDLDELSLFFAENWQEAMKHLYRGFVGSHLKQVGQDLASKAMDCEEEQDKDMGLFKLIFHLNPDAPLCWRGEIFADLSKLGEAIHKRLPEIDDNYFDLLNKGALVHFLEVKQQDPQMIAAFKLLETLSSHDREAAYYQLAFQLNYTDVFKWNNLNFTTADDLIVYLYENRERLDELAPRLVTNKYFLAWLRHQGFGTHVARWQEIYGS